MLILPSIDILNNKIVRLKKGDFNEITYYEQTPLDQAKLYKAYGFNNIHIVDLAGSKNGEINILQTLREIKTHTGINIQFGGGVRKTEDAAALLNVGVDKIVIGSLSIKDKKLFEQIISEVGEDKIIVAADTLNNKIAVTGWTETSTIDIEDHINYCNSLGINTYIITDIAKDGMLTGPNTSMYKRLQFIFPQTNLIVSGGIKNIEDVKDVKANNYYAVIVGRAIYEGRITLEELKQIGM